MKTRPGFTLVEILLATVLSALIMGAVYTTLTVQQRSARQIGVVTSTQQTIRSSLQILQGDFREMGARWGDIREAAPDHVKFRALRSVAFICAVTGTSSADMLLIGDARFQQGDTIYIQADRGTAPISDDTVVTAVVLNKGTPVNAGCAAGSFSAAPWSSMNPSLYGTNLSVLSSQGLSAVSVGAPVRSFRTLTYGVVAKGGSYVLGRKDNLADTAVTLIGPLARNGLVLQFYDSTSLIPTANLSAKLADIRRINVTVTGLTPGAVRTTDYTDTLSTDVAPRGN